MIFVDDEDQEEVVSSLADTQRIAHLNDKLEQTRQENREISDQLLLVKNQLDDMTRLRNAFEQDYRKARESQTRLLAENQEMQSRIASLS